MSTPHLRSIGVSLPNTLLEYIDSIRGTLNRSTAIRAILMDWYEQNGSLPKISSKRRKNRWYGMDTSAKRKVIRALESRVALAAWIAGDSENRRQITMKNKPDWATIEYLHALPTHEVIVE